MQDSDVIFKSSKLHFRCDISDKTFPVFIYGGESEISRQAAF